MTRSAMAQRTDDQAGFEVRFEWGIEGLSALAATSDVVIVVDVFSFSTAVEIATARGAIVYPAPWDDDRASSLAHSLGAELAVPRARMSAQAPYSLSPAALSAVRAGSRIVLPSPNGAAIALHAASSSSKVLAGCLRNATAVAGAARSVGPRVSVIAAGERRPNGALRPAVEDLVGAGAVISALGSSCSPEAMAAAGAFRSFDLKTQLLHSTSARELIDAGFREDVELAAAFDVSKTVPVLRDGCFTAHAR
jgi:2-phosphosulfolactate phosphatase